MALTEQHEQAAVELARIIDAFHARAEEEEERQEELISEAESKAAEQAARTIGERLYAEGGTALLWEVGQRTQELSDAPRYLDFWWDGIGKWGA